MATLDERRSAMSCGVFRPEEIRANEAGWQYANFEAA